MKRSVNNNSDRPPLPNGKIDMGYDPVTQRELYEANHAPNQPPVPPERQMIGVYVDSDEDANRLLRALEWLKSGCPMIREEKDFLSAIPSLDWDSFCPSSGEDEAWRSYPFTRHRNPNQQGSNTEPHRFETHPRYPDYCAFAGPGEDYCKKSKVHEIHQDPEQRS